MGTQTSSMDPRDVRGIEERSRVDEYARWIWDRISPHVGGRVLEVGCGAGSLVPWFRRHGEAYLGIDPAGDFIEANRRRWQDESNRVRFRRADLFEAGLGEVVDEFAPDTVVCLNVLEHLEDDRGALRRLGSFLPSGGSAVIQVPAYPWLYGANDRAVGHVRRYRRKQFRDLLETVLESVEIEAFNAAGILPWWLNGQLLRNGRGYFEGKSEGELGWLNRLIPVIRRIDSLLSLPIGISLLGFGRTPPSP